MKRLLLSLALLLTAGTAAHAQFHAGTKYIAASISGLDANYSKTAKFNLGLNADAGYYFADGWMARGNFNYNHAKSLDGFALGAGVRYSFLQNGIFIGAGLEYKFDKYTNTTSRLIQTVTTEKTYYVDPALGINPDAEPVINTTTDEKMVETKSNERVNNIRIPVEIGYTFYLNRFLAVEPAVYSKMSLNHFSEGTEFGFRLGLGFYFNRLHNVKHNHHHNHNRSHRNNNSFDF